MNTLLKRLPFITLVCMAGLLSGCGSDTNSDAEAGQGAVTETAGTETKAEAPAEENEAAKEKSLEDLAAYLVDKGVATGEKTEPMYQMIGAVGGFKYLDSQIEVYEYDTDSEAYKTIAETGEYSGNLAVLK